jgi:hypothetical protein
MNFRSALPVLSEDTTSIDEFLRHGGTAYNPWPELANPRGLGFGRANPWIRLIYLPNTTPVWLENDKLSLREQIRLWVGRVHEHIHVALDFTPVKEWVRVCLGLIYTSVGQLHDAAEFKWDHDTAAKWERFIALHEMLQVSVDRIRLAEELLATAFSFSAAAWRFADEEARELLREEETSWVRGQSAQLPEFEALYFDRPEEEGGFRNLARLLTNDGPFPTSVVLGQLGVFLEAASLTGRFPLTQEKQFWPEARASKDRCIELVAAARHQANPEDILRWVRERIIRDDLESWQVVLGTMAGLTQGQDVPAAQALWSLARGQQASRRKHFWRRQRGSWELERAFEVSSQPWLWPEASSDWADVDWLQVLLVPRKVGPQWYITPIRMSGSLSSGYESLLVTEAFRQQLDQGVGIRCPVALFNTSDGLTCRCDATWKNRLQQLSAWACAGNFGTEQQTNWSKLPFPCDRET